MNEALLQKLAKPMLVAAPVIWGSSFVVMKHSLDSFTPFYLLAFRFSAAGVLLGLFFLRRRRGLDLACWRAGAVSGTLLFLAYATQTFGLKGTTPGKNAFLTAIYCVVVPFLYWAITRKRPDRYHLAAALLCIAGIGLVSLSGGGNTLSLTPGDALTLLSGVLFAAHIISVTLYSQGRDIFLFTTLQFLFFGVWSWLCALLFREPFPAAPAMPALLGMIYLVVLSSCAALLFQNIGQKYTAPSTAAVLLSLEAPFGVFCSVLMGAEQLNPMMLLGFLLIFIAILCSETKFSFLRRKTSATVEPLP